MLLKQLTFAALVTTMALGATHAAKADRDDWGRGPFITFGYAAPYYAPPPPVYYAPPDPYYQPYPGWRWRHWHHWHHYDDDNGYGWHHGD